LLGVLKSGETVNISEETREAAAKLGYIIVEQWVADLFAKVLEETTPCQAAADKAPAEGVTTRPCVPTIIGPRAPDTQTE